MHSVFETAPASPAIPITFATKATWDAIRDGLAATGPAVCARQRFAAKPGKCLILPSADGQIAQVIFGLEEEDAKSRDLFRPGALPGLLPPGTYRFANAPHDSRLATLAFALGSYRFSRYRKADAPNVKLVPPDGVDAARHRAHGRGRHAGARSHQHAVQRHGPGGTGAGGAGTGQALRRRASTASSATICRDRIFR